MTKKVIALLMVLVLAVPGYAAVKKKKAPAKRMDRPAISRDVTPQKKAPAPKMSDEEWSKLWNGDGGFSTGNPYRNSDGWKMYNQSPAF